MKTWNKIRILLILILLSYSYVSGYVDNRYILSNTAQLTNHGSTSGSLYVNNQFLNNVETGSSTNPYMTLYDPDVYDQSGDLRVSPCDELRKRNQRIVFTLATNPNLPVAQAPMNKYSVRLKLAVSYNHVGNATPQQRTIWLQIDYNPSFGSSYKAKDERVIENADYATIQVQSCVIYDHNGAIMPYNGNVMADWFLLYSELQTETFAKPQLNNLLPPMQTAPGEKQFKFTLVTPEDNGTSYMGGGGYLDIEWSDFDVDASNPCAKSWAEYFELEYTFVDDYDRENTTLQYDFKNNSTRIQIPNVASRNITSDIKYRLPLVFERGYLVFRVRPVGLWGENYDQPIYGHWVGATQETATNGTTDLDNNGKGEFTAGTNFTSVSYIYKVEFGHEEDAKNWQSITTFAEEAKQKTVVSYYDGTSRNRQTQTNLSTDQNIVVAENIYDAFGREAINFLPTPLYNYNSTNQIETPQLGYRNNFNRNQQNSIGYSYLHFDVEDSDGGCLFAPEPASTSSGASQYYSPENRFMQNESVQTSENFNCFYIPDAKNYPFSQKEYLADPRGLVKRVGMPGETHHLGDGTNEETGINKTHEQFFLYSTPAQEELDRIFGNDVGFKEFYDKEVVIDANGQASVTYKDNKGHVIATALAGNTDPLLLDALDSEPSDLEKITEVIQTQVYDPSAEANSYHDVRYNTADGTIVMERVITITEPTNLTINYSIDDINAEILLDGCAGENVMCFDCVYDLDITVTETQCNRVISTHSQTIGSVSSFSHGIETNDSPEELTNYCKSDDALHPPYEITISITEKGNYHIVKTLKVNEQAVQLAVDRALEHTCITSQIDSTTDVVSNTDCDVTCIPCERVNSTLNGLAQEYPLLFQNNCETGICTDENLITNPCDEGYIAMYFDMLPTSGKYARTEDVNDRMSIFSNSENNLGISWRNVSFQFPQIINNVTTWQDVMVNIEENGIDVALQCEDNTTPNANGEVTLSSIKDRDFVIEFLTRYPELAFSLVQYHPEYCYYEFCVNNENIMQFFQELQLRNTNTYTEFSFFTSSDESIIKDDNFENDLFARDPLAQLFNNSQDTEISGLGQDFKRDLEKLSQALAICPANSSLPIYNIIQMSIISAAGMNLEDQTTTSNEMEQLLNSRQNRLLQNSTFAENEWKIYVQFYTVVHQKYFDRYRRIMLNRQSANQCVSRHDALSVNPPWDTYPAVFPSPNQILNMAGSGHEENPLTNINCLTPPSGSVSQTAPSGCGTSCYRSMPFMFLIKDIAEKDITQPHQLNNININLLSHSVDNVTIPLINQQILANNEFRWIQPTINTTNGSSSLECAIQANNSTNNTAVNILTLRLHPKTLLNRETFDEATHSMQSIAPDELPDWFISSDINSYKEIITFYCLEGDATDIHKFTIKGIVHHLYTNNDGEEADEYVDILFEGEVTNVQVGGCGITTTNEGSSNSSTAQGCTPNFNLNEFIYGFIAPIAGNISSEIFDIAFPIYVPQEGVEHITESTAQQLIANSNNPNADAIFVNVSQASGTGVGDNFNHLEGAFYFVKYSTIDPLCACPIKSVNGTTAVDCNTSTNTHSFTAIINFNSLPSSLHVQVKRGNTIILSQTINGPFSFSNYTVTIPNITNPIGSNEIYTVEFSTGDFNLPCDYTISYQPYCNTTQSGSSLQSNSSPLAFLFSGQNSNFRMQSSNVEGVIYPITCLNNPCPYSLDITTVNNSVECPSGFVLRNELLGDNASECTPSHTIKYSEMCQDNNQVRAEIVFNSSCINFGQCCPSDNPPIIDTEFCCLRPTVESILSEDPCASFENSHIEGNENIVTEIIHQYYRDLVETEYRKKCVLNALGHEKLTIQYGVKYHHYTLYYYDQAGNLFATVPPEGVHIVNLAQPSTEHPTVSVGQQIQNARMHVVGYNPIYLLPNFDNNAAPTITTPPSPLHKMVTTYFANSLNAVTVNHTPDGGSTRFAYDELGRIILSQNDQQKDEGQYSFSHYDALGRLTLSGVANLNGAITDANSNLLPFINYSASGTSSINDLTTLLNNNALAELTLTAYDNINENEYVQAFGFVPTDINLQTQFTTLGTNYLYNRVAASFFAKQPQPISQPNRQDYTHAYFYKYDIHGNVNELVQDNKILNRYLPTTSMLTPAQRLEIRLKKLQYTYDLISGKVNTFVYQPKKPDQFMHFYKYDADNRLTEVYTAQHPWEHLLVREADAKYYYYKHGPLARIELGSEQVQGIDYYYNILGWLKGVNSATLSPTRDPGHDGITLATNYPFHHNFAGDAMGFSIGYHKNDYTAIKTSDMANNANADVLQFAPYINNPESDFEFGNLGNDLYNGNISHIHSTQIAFADNPLLSRFFRYDALNRIKSIMGSNAQYAPASNAPMPPPYNPNEEQTIFETNVLPESIFSDKYAEDFNYDANGNIESLFRRDNEGFKMDELYYGYDQANGNIQSNNGYINEATYNNNPQNNQLTQVVDKTDIQDAQNNQLLGRTNPDNVNDVDQNMRLGYDKKGRIIESKEYQPSLSRSDYQTISWTSTDKINSVNKTTTLGNTTISTHLDFEYNALGQRILKAQDMQPGGKGGHFTYYVRDIQGNQLAVYYFDKEKNQLTLTEQNIYGSSRIATYKPNMVLWNDGTQNEETSSYDELPYARIATDSVPPADSLPWYMAYRAGATTTPSPIYTMQYYRGQKQYELTNHLGNVMATVTDRKVHPVLFRSALQAKYPILSENYSQIQNQSWYPSLYTANEYYAFGSPMPAKQFTPMLCEQVTKPQTIYTELPEYEFSFLNETEKQDWGKATATNADDTSKINVAVESKKLEVSYQKDEYDSNTDPFFEQPKTISTPGSIGTQYTIGNLSESGEYLLSFSIMLDKAETNNFERDVKKAANIQVMQANTEYYSAKEQANQEQTEVLLLQNEKESAEQDLSQAQANAEQAQQQAEQAIGTDYAQQAQAIADDKQAEVAQLETQVQDLNQDLQQATTEYTQAMQYADTLAQQAQVITDKTEELQTKINIAKEKETSTYLQVQLLNANNQVIDTREYYEEGALQNVTFEYEQQAGENYTIRLLRRFDSDPIDLKDSIGDKLYDAYISSMLTPFSIDEVSLSIKQTIYKVSTKCGDDKTFYRFGFNGQEKDEEIKGHGNHNTAEFWQYDTRTGRRWNLDPVVKEHESPYVCFGNNPIFAIDPNGADTLDINKNDDGKWVIAKTQIVDGDDVFRVKNGDDIKTHIFCEGEYGKRMCLLNVENDSDYTIGIYHISGQNGDYASGYAVTPGGDASSEVDSGKRLADDTYTIAPTGDGTNQSQFKWVQPLISKGESEGYVGGRGVKIHPAPSKSTETEVGQWTEGCYVICNDYTKSGTTIKYNSAASLTTSKEVNCYFGSTKDYESTGTKARPGSDFGNGIDFKLIQKTGF